MADLANRTIAEMVEDYKMELEHQLERLERDDQFNMSIAEIEDAVQQTDAAESMMCLMIDLQQRKTRKQHRYF